MSRDFLLLFMKVLCIEYSLVSNNLLSLPRVKKYCQITERLQLNMCSLIAVESLCLINLIVL